MLKNTTPEFYNTSSKAMIKTFVSTKGYEDLFQIVTTFSSKVDHVDMVEFTSRMTPIYGNGLINGWNVGEYIAKVHYLGRRFEDEVK